MTDREQPVTALSTEEMAALDTVLEVIVLTGATSDLAPYITHKAEGFLAALAGVDPPLTVVPLDREREAVADLRAERDDTIRDNERLYAENRDLRASLVAELDVERLARAHDSEVVRSWLLALGKPPTGEQYATAIAAEYARLIEDSTDD